MKKLFLKTLLLLCALVAGSTSVWAETYSLTPDQASTGSSETTYITTLTAFRYDGVSWKMNQWNPKTLQIKTNQTSAASEFRFYNTSAFPGKITKVVITFSTLSVSDASKLMFKGGKSEVSSTSDGTTGTWDSKTKSLTWTPNSSDNFTYFAFYQNGKAASGTNYLATENAIVVTYETTPAYTITPAVNNAEMGSAEVSGTTITATPNSGYRVKSGSEGYTVTVGSADVTNNGDNTFTVDPSTDCTVQINFEAIPSHSVTCVADPAAGGTVKAVATSVREEETTSITATPNAGYKFVGWSVTGTGASLSSTSTNPTTLTMGTADATVTATFEAVTTYAISYSVNGIVVDSKNVEEGEDIDFSAPATGVPVGYVFKGWVVEANKIDTPTDTDPSANYVTSATSTADITYYAVMAVSGASEPSLTKMGSSDDSFNANDNIVIVAKGTAYAMYQETVNSSYVNTFSFVNNATTIDSDAKRYWTLSAASTDWYLGDNTNGYLYNAKGSNNLASSSEFKTEWTISWNSTESAFTIIGNSRCLSCRTDLSGGNQNKYRMGGSSTSSPSGNAYFDIYKFVPSIEVFKNYCTTVPTATITLADACTDGEGTYYGTYSNSQAFVVPEDLTVSTVSISDGAMTLSNYSTGDIVKANTGVLVAATSAGEKSITLAAGGEELAGNMLKASAAGVTAAAMAEADSDCTFYRLTMHNGTDLGFWWGAEDGASFDVAANKAYLAVPTADTGEVRGFSLTGDNADGMKTIDNGQLTMDNAVYDLQGRRVVKPTRGLYIVNGKKVVK